MPKEPDYVCYARSTGRGWRGSRTVGFNPVLPLPIIQMHLRRVSANLLKAREGLLAE